MSLFDTGVRPYIDEYLKKKSEEVRDYQGYWSASSAGYCYRKLIFERLKLPQTKDDPRKTRVFEAGHVFHKWYQDITKDAGISIAQELELQDEELMIRGHIDDLVLIEGKLILYDAKTQNSRAFTYMKGRPMSYYHKMQLGTYLNMLNKATATSGWFGDLDEERGGLFLDFVKSDQKLTEARVLKISKDDLRMAEQQLLWDDELKDEIVTYWNDLNSWWNNKEIPPCMCANEENGFMAKEAYNPYYYQGEPCSIKWLLQNAKEGKLDGFVSKEWKAKLSKGEI